MRRSKDLFATTLTPEDLSLGISELNPAETATFPDGTKGCNALHFAALHSNYPVIGQLFTLGVPFAQNEVSGYRTMRPQLS